MNTLLDKTTEVVRARDVSFAGDRLCIELSDGRELSVPYKKIPWLKWLAKATPSSAPIGRSNPAATRFTGSNWTMAWKSPPARHGKFELKK